MPAYPVPHKPDRNQLTEGEMEVFRAWSRKRSQIYSENNRSVSKRIQVERTLQVAEQYAKYDKFYYVWQNDFRSRKYASSTFLTPQSADWSKALLTFARGVPINNWETHDSIQGANLYGNDKVSLDDRERGHGTTLMKPSALSRPNTNQWLTLTNPTSSWHGVTRL